MKTPPPGRLEDWRARFADLVVARRAAAFAWGQTDCCLWAADAIAAMTGRDLASTLRGYSDAPGAVRALRRVGAQRVFDYVDAVLARTSRARDGDVVGVACPDGSPLDLLMIADGGAAWAQDSFGLVRLPVPPGAVFWSV